MFARCSRCDRTFETQQYGRQRCPHCQSEVFIRDPREPVSDAYAPPRAFNDAPAIAEGEGIPWDRREQLGLWKALLETVKLSITEPSAFFSHVRYDKTTGIHLYFFLTVVVPVMISSVIEWAMTNPQKQFDQIQESARMLGHPEWVQYAQQLRPFLGEKHVTSLIGSLIGAPFFCFLGLYVFAGLAHLIMVMLKKAPGGWQATLTANVFAGSPGFTIIMPMCGWLIMGCWITALQIIGLAKAQRTTTGYGTAGVLGVHLLFTCCICAVVVPIVIGAASLMGAAFQTG